MEGLSDKLVARVFGCCAILTSSLTFAIALLWLAGVYNHTAPSFWVVVFCFSLMVVVMLGIKLKCYMSVGPFAREWMVAGLVIVGMATQILMQDRYLSNVTGADRTLLQRFGKPGEELALFSTKHCDILDQVLAEVSLMLCLDTFVMASHLALPIRWQVLVFVELASLLLLMVPAILFDSLEPNSLRVANFFFFVALIVMSSFGKRAMEYQERCLFQKYPALISSCAHFSLCSFLTPSGFSL